MEIYICSWRYLECHLSQHTFFWNFKREILPYNNKNHFIGSRLFPQIATHKNKYKMKSFKTHSKLGFFLVFSSEIKRCRTNKNHRSSFKVARNVEPPPTNHSTPQWKAGRRPSCQAFKQPQYPKPKAVSFKLKPEIIMES